MSKAFTKEDDEREDEDGPEPSPPRLPPGVKNYITPQGAARLRAELRHLHDVERPEVTRTVAWAASNGDRSENADYLYGKRRLREIDRRIRFLTKRLEAAEEVDPTTIRSDRVRFGATVTVKDEEGQERIYRIVGVDETDIRRGHVSWISPLGSALLKAKAGDTVTFRAPKGETDLEIIKVEYLPIPPPTDGG